MKLFVIIGLLALFSCKDTSNKTLTTNENSSKSVDKTQSVNQEKNTSTINFIKKEYSSLQNKLQNKLLDSTYLDYNCDEEGKAGSVTYFSEKGSLKIIKHSYGEYSHFEATEMYYVSNNTPFFLFKKETYWTFDGGTVNKPETKDDITERRIYLAENKVIEYLEKNYTIKSKDKNNPIANNIANKKGEFNADELLKTYQLLLKNKNKKGEQNCLQ